MLITPTWLMDFESRMRVITSSAYSKLDSNLWYKNLTSFKTSENKREVLVWLLDTARIDLLDDGEMHFEDMQSHIHEYEHSFAGRGLSLDRYEFEDKDGKGIEFATQWSKQIGAWSSYWPQEQVANLMKANTALCYDGLPLFDTDHLVNPQDASVGVFANDFTGAAAGDYPGALPIDESVSVEDALTNLGLGLAYIRTIPTPNGGAPRNLRATKLIHPPKMSARAQQLTGAKFIAQAVGSGGGSGDVEAIIKKYGIAEPVEAPELSAAFGGSDTTYYLVVEEIANGDDLGGLVYSEREAFQIQYHGIVDDAQLARMNKLQWMCRGRNVVTTGHPYAVFRFQGA